MKRNWFSVVSLALLTALIVPQLAGQAKLTLTPALLTLKKSIGSPQAPIRIEIFSDYQCPICRDMYMTTTRQLIDDYVTTGKVYLVHRDFPLPMHSHSRDAAHWLNAAAAAGCFQAAETALYSTQDDWGATGKVEQTLAKALSVGDMSKVRAIELAQRVQLDAAVESDIKLGNSRSVDSTPTVCVIQGSQITPLPPGFIPYALLKQYLDSLLQHR